MNYEDRDALDYAPGQGKESQHTITITDTGHENFNKVLMEMAAVHQKKNHDYASTADPLSNFILQAELTGQSVDMVFFNAIAIKAARLKELVGKGKSPKNESVNDTILDMANYAALWKSYRMRPGVADAPF